MALADYNDIATVCPEAVLECDAGHDFADFERERELVLNAKRREDLAVQLAVVVGRDGVKVRDCNRASIAGSSVVGDDRMWDEFLDGASLVPLLGERQSSSQIGHRDIHPWLNDPSLMYCLKDSPHVNMSLC